MKSKISRRELLRRSATFGAAGLGLVVLGAGCGGEGDDGAKSCSDTTGLSPQQRSTRSSLAYVEQSPHGSQKNCLNCSFYTPETEMECGACTLVPGPIVDEAYCNSWAAKAS